MSAESVNLKQKLTKVEKAWSPKIVAKLNDYEIKVVKLEGEFVWHNHADTDEMFLCVHGEMDICLRDGTVTLHAGELFVVPKGVEHKPVARGECHAVIIEPGDVVNTGDAGGELTAPGGEWV